MDWSKLVTESFMQVFCGFSLGSASLYKLVTLSIKKKKKQVYINSLMNNLLKNYQTLKRSGNTILLVTS